MHDNLPQALQQQLSQVRPMLDVSQGELLLLKPVPGHSADDHVMALAALQDQGAICQFTHVHAHDQDTYLAVVRPGACPGTRSQQA